jgi:hypothetical protein
MPINGRDDLPSHQLADRRRTPEREPFSSNIAHTRRPAPVTQQIEVQQAQKSPVPLLALPQMRPELRHEAPPSRREHSSDISGKISALGSANISDMHMTSTPILEPPTLPYEHTTSQHVFPINGDKPRPPRHVPPAQAQLEATTSEAAIQVTIGRVEVRAVTTPTATTRSQQQSARSSVMSLDEYLRQQERGGRR